MSRPSTPIHGRPRSRSGTRSPANIADRAVCKIAGKRVFLCIISHFILVFERLINLNRMIMFPLSILICSRVNASNETVPIHSLLCWTIACLISFSSKFH